VKYCLVQFEIMKAPGEGPRYYFYAAKGAGERVQLPALCTGGCTVGKCPGSHRLGGLVGSMNQVGIPGESYENEQAVSLIAHHLEREGWVQAGVHRSSWYARIFQHA
jgi:hypothetical protein